MIRSIFGRILLANCIIIVITTVTFAILTGYLIRMHIIDNKRTDVLTKGQAAVSLIVNDSHLGPLVLEQNIATINDLVGATCWITDEHGNTLAGIAPEAWQSQYPDVTAQLGSLASETKSHWIGRNNSRSDRSVLVALPLPDDEPDLDRILFLYASAPRVTKPAETMEALLLYSALVGLMTSIAFAYFISRSLTSPIKSISQTARRFARGDYAIRTAATDDSEIGRLGRTLNSMAESLASIEQNRREFLANVSHELKTPVASVQALTEALIDDVVPEEKKLAFLNSILSANKRMNRLIHDLLDLSRLEAGEISATLETIDLRIFLQDQLGNHPLLTDRQVTLQLEFGEGDLKVIADPDRLTQVISNLMSNAWRYAPPQSIITISTRRQEQMIAVSITDQGRGISPTDIPLIWERFYRSDKSRSRDHGGTGLGLAITKKLVELMNGQITVSSLQGQGATFTIILPAA
jgi:signal transduction histidine kinase